ncbi:TetR/AcrR family transcriptional regulator [Thermomonospora umbrina]|uniref:TetR/AcrR family transcriptional regulator n=1 Tax=Thermomonospora umbrina TaxID=111806 RepID=UPI001FE811E2|nr:TetR/AcrR family transcriptional regulator [Thermomonospora umbrina]
MAHPETDPGRGSPSRRRIRGMDADQRREQRRRQLLESALELFAAHGYQNTSIEQLCQHAYVGTKGFYEVFDGREACYLALMRQVTEQIQADVLAHLDTAPEDPDRAERALLTAFAHAVVDDPRRALVTFGQAGAVSPAVERQRRANRRWAADFIESIWRRHGVIHPRDDTAGPPRATAIGLVGGLFDLIADWLLDADLHDPAHVEALITDLTEFYRVVRTGARTADRPRE